MYINTRKKGSRRLDSPSPGLAGPPWAIIFCTNAKPPSPSIAIAMDTARRLVEGLPPSFPALVPARVEGVEENFVG